MSQGMTSIQVALVALVLTPAGAAQGGEEALPDTRLGQRTAPLLLLSRPDVRADVGLDATLTGDAERAIADLFTRAASLRGKSGPEAVEGRRAIDLAMQKWLETRLSEDQFRRLIEIDLQWEGPSALISRPVLADRLHLTPAQRTALGQAVHERNNQRARDGFRLSAEQHLAKRALVLLSPDQRTRWKTMLGREFVPQLAAQKSASPK